MALASGNGHEGAPAGLGGQLRAARLAQRRTLDELASASGLTKGFLSRLERGQTNASVAALMRLCDTLDVEVGSLFAAPPSGQVVRSGAAPVLLFGGIGMTEHQLTPRTERRIQVILSQIAPGGGSGQEMYRLPADVEFAFLLAGDLLITFAGETVALRAGDSFTFNPSASRTFQCPSGSAGATVLWVLSPALPDGSRVAPENHS